MDLGGTSTKDNSHQTVSREPIFNFLEEGGASSPKKTAAQRSKWKESSVRETPVKKTTLTKNACKPEKTNKIDPHDLTKI